MADPAEVRGMLIDTEVGTDVDSRIGNRLEFQWTPSEVRNSVRINWSNQEIPGRSHPIMQYSSTGQQTWSLSLLFDGDATDPTFVADRARWIKSLCYPQYKDRRGQLQRPPHVCLLVYGQWLNVKVVVTAYEATYGPLYMPDTLYPLNGKIDVELTEFVRQGIDYRRVRR